jgi:hypothetical protein
LLLCSFGGLRFGILSRNSVAGHLF